MGNGLSKRWEARRQKRDKKYRVLPFADDVTVPIADANGGSSRFVQDAEGMNLILETPSA